MSKEAMKQAQEALYSDNPDIQLRAAIALRQALSEQEPVAWASSLDFDDDDQEIIPAKDKGKLGTRNCDIPLYATPKREWVGLTAYEIQEIHSGNQHWGNFACAIEAKLKEKNT
jgi:hypothetical protein